VQRSLERCILFRGCIDRIMKHDIQISGRQGFRILPREMIPHGIAHKACTNPSIRRSMRGEHRKAAHHARMMRDEISDIGGISHQF